MEHAVDIESVLGNLGPRAAALCYEFPQLVWAVDVAREATAHADDGDGCVGVHDWRNSVFLLGVEVLSPL